MSLCGQDALNVDLDLRSIVVRVSRSYAFNSFSADLNFLE